MAATKSACLTLRVSIADSSSSVTTIGVAAFAQDGCTIRAIVLETQTTAGAAARIAISGGGNNLLVGATAVPNPVGGQDLALTGTSSHLSLKESDDIVITMSAATSKNDVVFFYGEDPAPAVTSVVS